MSVGRRQRPEYRVILDYVNGLVDEGAFSAARLCEAFVPIYLEMIPEDDQRVPFELIHRHDDEVEYRRKKGGNDKHLSRILRGEVRFTLSVRNPLIYAIEAVKAGLGVELHKQLVRNQGLLYIPVDFGSDGDVLYADFVSRFADANAAVVRDVQENQMLNDPETRHKLIALLEQVTGMLRAIDDAEAAL